MRTLAFLSLLTSHMALGSLYLVLPFLYPQNGHNDMTLVFVKVSKIFHFKFGKEVKTITWNVLSYKSSDVSVLHCFFTCFMYHFFCHILLDRTFVTPRLAWTHPILGKESSLPMSGDKSSSQCRFKASSPPVPTKHIKLLSADEKITKGQSFDR